MPGSWNPGDFPGLIEHQTYEQTSLASPKYNCIAWAAGEDHRPWWPDQAGIGYWPTGIPRDVTIDAFIQTYGTLGYQPCGMDGSSELGYQKIALYAEKDFLGQLVPTHAALQLPNGHWSSKIGVRLEDIEHFTANAVVGPAYGVIVCYLKRRL